jgi:plasmid stabilization system protein ParE
LRVRWSRRALQRLDEIGAYISREKYRGLISRPCTDCHVG